MHENRVYNVGQFYDAKLPMSKYANQALASFGQRLARLRKEAGYTQLELAEEIGVTRRMIAYYETESEHPPANLLVDLTKALNVTADELLGIQKPKRKKGTQPDSRLLRRLQQIEKLPAKDKRQLIQLIETFLEAAQYRHSA
jgi:transcriptional regulator with XRE-family HTH domain